MFGAGVQARAHLEAMAALRSLERVLVVSRTPGRAEELCDLARASGLVASVGTPGDVGEGDLVCTCTTSPEPLFDGRLLRPGAHVNAVGAYLPESRELDTATIERARVVVETREVALAEAGDLLLPIGEGAIGPGHITADLSELVHGAQVRTAPDQVTVFKSVGMAFEDLVVAAAAYGALA
jgi:ornithine cyclodeaminase